VRNPLLATFGCWLLTALVSGCLDNRCEQIDDAPVRYTDGHTNTARTFYQSSTPDEPLLRFPAARSFHLEHGLGERPVDVSVFVSFFADPDKEQSLAAGDEALITITPDYIGVENNTCADFFIRVTAWSEPPEAAPSESDALGFDAAVLSTQSSGATDAAPMLDGATD
jgi:hypothetical protein